MEPLKLADAGLEVLPECKTKTREVVCFVVDNTQHPDALDFFKELNNRLGDLDIITGAEGKLLEVKILQ